MRIVILAASVYSETACATAAHLAVCGYVPVGAVALPALDRGTLLRKLGQWGMRGVADYALRKFNPGHDTGRASISNPCLEPFLKNELRVFRSLREVASFYDFPVAICSDQNAPEAIARVKQWAPDLIIFTGGNILGQTVLDVPRLGVLNVHLGLLPEIRGMSSPEWSLLRNVPVGITIHFMNAGIDTGPILRRFEFPRVDQCESLSDLRKRLAAFGIEKVGEVVSALDRGTIFATPQQDLNQDNQYFVMHEWLRARAAERLTRRPAVASPKMVNG